MKSGLETTWTLGKIIFPITLIVTILQYTPVLPLIISWIEPLMGLIGLSGEAAVPLVLANVLNLYAGIGAIVSFDFTVKEVFIMAMMMSFSHNLLVESALASRVGVNWWFISGLRIALAILAAIFINLLWPSGSEMAQYGLISNSEVTLTSWSSIILHGIQTALLAVLQLSLIVIPLMIV